MLSVAERLLRTYEVFMKIVTEVGKFRNLALVVYALLITGAPAACASRTIMPKPS